MHVEKTSTARRVQSRLESDQGFLGVVVPAHLINNLIFKIDHPDVPIYVRHSFSFPQLLRALPWCGSLSKNPLLCSYTRRRFCGAIG